MQSRECTRRGTYWQFQWKINKIIIQDESIMLGTEEHGVHEWSKCCHINQQLTVNMSNLKSCFRISSFMVRIYWRGSKRKKILKSMLNCSIPTYRLYGIFSYCSSSCVFFIDVFMKLLYKLKSFFFTHKNSLKFISTGRQVWKRGIRRLLLLMRNYA